MTFGTRETWNDLDYMKVITVTDLRSKIISRISGLEGWFSG